MEWAIEWAVSNGMEWAMGMDSSSNGMGNMEWAIEWAIYSVECNGMEWNAMEWQWNGMQWNGMNPNTMEWAM